MMINELMRAPIAERAEGDAGENDGPMAVTVAIK